MKTIVNPIVTSQMKFVCQIGTTKCVGCGLTVEPHHTKTFQITLFVNYQGSTIGLYSSDSLSFPSFFSLNKFLLQNEYVVDWLSATVSLLRSKSRPCCIKMSFIKMSSLTCVLSVMQLSLSQFSNFLALNHSFYQHGVVEFSHAMI